MDYLRIIKLSAILFASLVIASTVVTLIFSNASGQFGKEFWVTQYIVSFSVSLVAYIYFARNQKSQHYKFAVLVATFYWVLNIISGLVMSLFLGVQTLNETIAFDLALTLIIVPLGTYIGLKFTRASNR